MRCYVPHSPNMSETDMPGIVTGLSRSRASLLHLFVDMHSLFFLSFHVNVNWFTIDIMKGHLGGLQRLRIDN